MKKFFVLTLIVILTLTSFVSCSKEKAAEQAPAAAPAAPAAPAAEKAAPAAPAPSTPAEAAPAPAEPKQEKPAETAPAAEKAVPAKLEQPEITEKVVTLNVAGFDVIARVTKTAAEFTYPSAITKDDINGFVEFVNRNYADYVTGVTYGFTGVNRVLVTYPESADVLNSVEIWANLCQYAVEEYLAYLKAEAAKTYTAQQAALDATPAAPAEPKQEKPVETKPATVTMISAQDAQAAVDALEIPGMPTSVHKAEDAAAAQQAATEVLATEAQKTAEYDLSPEGYVPFRHHVVDITVDSNNFFQTTPVRIGVDAAYTYRFIENLGVGGELGWADGYGFHLLAKVNAGALFTDFFGISGGIGGGANLYTDNTFGALAGAEAGFDFNISKLIGITLKTGIRYYFATGNRAAQLEWRPFKLGVKISI